MLVQPVQPVSAVPSPAAALQPQQHQTGSPSQRDPAGLPVRPAASHPAEQQPAPAAGTQPAGALPAGSRGAVAGPVGPAGPAHSAPVAQTPVAAGQVRAAAAALHTSKYLNCQQLWGAPRAAVICAECSVSLQHLPPSPAHLRLHKPCSVTWRPHASPTPAWLPVSHLRGPLLPCNAHQRCSPLLHTSAPAIVTLLRSPAQMRCRRLPATLYLRLRMLQEPVRVPWLGKALYICC